MSTLNTEIHSAINANNVERARALLGQALRDADADTYYLASLVALDDDQRKAFLQKALDIFPFHTEAYTAMGKLNAPSLPQQPRSAPAARPVESEPDFLAVPVPPVAPQPPQVAPQPPQVAPQPPKFLTARVANGASISQYPWPNAPTRTNVSARTTCIPLGRTESGNWINVLYLGTTGHDVLGWIEANLLNDVKFGEKIVNLSDLPITQFEYNTRQEIVEFAKKIQNSYMRTFGFFMLALGSGAWALMTYFTYPYSWNDNYTALVAEVDRNRIIALVMVGIFLLLMIRAWRNAANQLYMALGPGGSNIWIQRLNGIRRGKQNSTENMMEDQARIAAMQIAGNIATRFIPNKQDITFRQR